MAQSDVDHVYGLHRRFLEWLAVWQRQPDGGWKIVRDIFSSD